MRYAIGEWYDCEWSMAKFIQRVAAVLILGLISSSNSAYPQDVYPTRSITLIVPSAPGGANDVAARLWAERLNSIGTIVIDNRGGAGQLIGAKAVASSIPDGYTLLLGSSASHVLQPLLMDKKLSYDPVRDFDPIAVFAKSSTAVVVNPSLPVHTLSELIAYAKANPGKLAFGHGGAGGNTHVTGELFAQLSGAKILQVAYRGLGPATNSLLAGDLQVLMINITNQVIGLAESGKVRILSVNSYSRHSGLPNTPTSIEAGLSAFVSENFYGIFAPAGTPKPIIERLNLATQKGLLDPGFAKKLANAGLEVLVGYGPEKSAAYITDELAKWRPVMKVLKTK